MQNDAPRYDVRWNNGFWKLVDLWTYRDVCLFRLREHAIEAAWEANTNPAAVRSVQ